MFHNVRAFHGGAYAPNLPLEITPEFLELTLTVLREKGYEIAPIGDLHERLAANDGKRFAALTFDDGYRDNLEIAAPILRRHGAPYTIYVTTGFVERTARLWWLEMEAAIGALEVIEISGGGGVFSAPARTVDEKHQAFTRAYSFLRELDEPAMLDCLSRLLEQAGVRPQFAELCMTWDEIRAAV
ncbi:MAG: polysaccharide deacetylase family protein, partial [Beijerinckiaceae bacterium]|nr:polysaccharide deacetylase family protein [Beijerinckiaceae bacterium]